MSTICNVNINTKTHKVTIASKTTTETLDTLSVSAKLINCSGQLRIPPGIRQKVKIPLKKRHTKY